MKHLRSQSGFVHILFIVLVLVAIGGCGYFAYQARKSSHITVITPTPPLISSPTVTSVVADKYVGWKTYSSSRDGYSIRYPASWILLPESASDGPYIRNFDPNSKPRSSQNSAPDYPEGYINLRVVVTKNESNHVGTGMSTAEWYGALGTRIVAAGPVSYAPAEVKSLKVNNLDAKSSKSVFDETDEDIFILHNGSLYQIILYPYGSSSEATVKQMLDSFKFI